MSLPGPERKITAPPREQPAPPPNEREIKVEPLRKTSPAPEPQREPEKVPA